jgi:hypothetical protein
MDDQFGLVFVGGEQEMVLINHLNNLILIKRRNKLHQKVLIILQNHYPELLKHMLQIRLLLHWRLNHRM